SRPPTTSLRYRRLTITSPSKTKNIINVDLDKANKTETNSNIKNINNYVKSLSGSSVNEYTGMFEGYNLIMICAESFSDRMISPELTPTLYKLYNNGFVFRNYYGMMKSITTNGEYSFLTGLIPQTSGNVDDLKKNSTFLASVGKYLPFNMANAFNEIGGTTCAYHGHSSTYYHRGETHLNLGYRLLRFTDKAIVNGVDDKTRKLSFKDGNIFPSSDYELAVQTLDDYLSVKDENGNIVPFTAYYMTYSGHHPYYDLSDKEHKKNPQSWTMREDENGKLTKDNPIDSLSYNEVVKTFIACNMQVEMMLTEMLERLEAAGVLDKTVIVLTNDHYPYALPDANFRNLAGKSVNTDFGIYENAFICYNSGMEEPIIVDTPCCTVDILPTLLNLFGFEYDSRLLAGTDILDSKSFHIAMLYNKNFITDKIMYKNSNGKITYLVDKSEVSDSYVTSCINYVANKFEISLQIVNTDYYRQFFKYVEQQK
ncbi:MAG: LTA synthase family protein, partial [Firmicutes bacterium]|nr:LTA synthase family protein [Candidatus Colimorpha enterica]